VLDHVNHGEVPAQHIDIDPALSGCKIQQLAQLLGEAILFVVPDQLQLWISQPRMNTERLAARIASRTSRK
jgi:hypothetical protein